MADAASKRSPRTCECGEHAFCALTKWGVVLVNPEDAELLDVPWQIVIATNSSVAYAQRRGMRLHIEVSKRTGQPAPLTDHENGNGLDNRRRNLRPCSHAENMRNRRATVGSSRFKGVRLNASGTWRAEIQQNGEYLHLGSFGNEEQAARQYDRAARVFFGKFARTNEMMGLL